MTDDLVKRLRQLGDRTGLMFVDYDTTIEAADRIEELGAANDKLSCDALQLYARIEKLEAALRDVIDNFFDSTRICEIARKALEGKDD